MAVSYPRVHPTAESADHLGPRNVAGLMEEGIDAFEEANGVRQFCVELECRFVHPARMNVKELRVARRAEDVETQAAGLGARRPRDFAQGLLHCTFFSCTRVQPHKDVLLHGSPPLLLL